LQQFVADVDIGTLHFHSSIHDIASSNNSKLRSWRDKKNSIGNQQQKRKVLIATTLSRDCKRIINFRGSIRQQILSSQACGFQWCAKVRPKEYF